jgi:hypothetical protein
MEINELKINEDLSICSDKHNKTVYFFYIDEDTEVRIYIDKEMTKKIVKFIEEY